MPPWRRYRRSRDYYSPKLLRLTKRLTCAGTFPHMSSPCDALPFRSHCWRSFDRLACLWVSPAPPLPPIGRHAPIEPMLLFIRLPAPLCTSILHSLPDHDVCAPLTPNPSVPKSQHFYSLYVRHEAQVSTPLFDRGRSCIEILPGKTAVERGRWAFP